MSTDDATLLAEGRRVVEVEADSLRDLAGRLGPDFVEACRLVAGAKGRVIVSGIGKSGIIARKIAATLTSTGTPATFLHPVEGLHGDLGIVSEDDVALLLSKSGETSELSGLLDYLLRLGVPVVALTGRVDSSLARHARIVLDCAVSEEACPMDLAPTSSTTVTLALGDALAVVVLQLKGFEPDDFARFHPGGSLGRKLTVRVGDVMVATGYPLLGPDAPMRDAVVPIAEERGTVPVVDDGTRLVGVVTAGDLTRLIERDEAGWASVRVEAVMSRTPLTARPDERGAAVVHRLEERGVMAAPVVDDEGRLTGMVHLHDLMRAGAV
ncbi:KpsF/GutQ family sugar-phosphate isomerase [Gaopeijia maritima]|uniref:KpsF/GutQ family sugar-phosphate isomerase n=1 Tax=Gaopeijia maritima TaxID=3119007 RepID=A0ABU9E7S3_9BACT